MDNIFIVGTRAQLIKVAPVIHIFENANLPVIFLLTGQHHDTMQDLIDEFDIKTQPINLLKDKKEHSNIISLLLWLPKSILLLIYFLKKYNQANIFIHGDTLTTLISALSGKLTKKRIIHLESGLTSKKITTPFPEEIIRRIVFKLTDIAFCPSKRDMDNMKKYSKIKAINTNGNTIIDSINLLKIGENKKTEKETILVSIHRFQNIYNKKKLEKIAKLLVNICTTHKVYFVLHPATLKKLKEYNLYQNLQREKNIKLLERMTYKIFLNLALSTECVITDGGSNQEELSLFGHPTIILRDTTERMDGIGDNAILMENPDKIYEYIKEKEYLTLSKNPHKKHKSPSFTILSFFMNENLNENK